MRGRNLGAWPGTHGGAGNPPDRLLDDEVTGLAAPREPPVLADNERLSDTAAGMAARAGRNGRERIDPVAESRRGGG